MGVAGTTLNREEMEGEGSAGSGLSIGEVGDLGKERPPNDGVAPSVVAKENAESSKETVCGAFVLTSLPWRCLGVDGLGLTAFGGEVPTSR